MDDDHNNFEALGQEFEAYHAETKTAIETLTADVKSLTEKWGNQSRGAVARNVGIQTTDQRLHQEIEQRAAMTEWIRTGAVSPERRALQTTPDSAGGFVVPTVIDKQIQDQLISISPVRS